MQVVILKQPLYGTILWNGVDFIYNSFTEEKSNDYYIYSLTVDGKSTVYTKYVNQINTPPVANNVSLTADAYGVNVININSLASDATNPFSVFKIESVTGALYGTATTDGDNIYYTSNTFNSVENLTYTVTDKEYKSTATLTLSVANGVVLDTTPKGLGLLYLSKNRFNNLKSLSGGWSSLNHILTTYGPIWDAVDYVRYTAMSDNVDNAEPSWTDVYNARPQLSSFLTTLSTNSADWDLDVVDGIPIYNLSYPKSQNWNTVYTILTANSGSWESAILSFDVLSSSLNVKTPIYNGLNQTVNDNKDTLWDTTELNYISARYFGFWNGMLSNIKESYWDYGFYNLNGLSANLAIYTKIFDDLYTKVSSNSATNWDNTFLNTISSNYFGLWDSVHQTLTAFKDKWNGVNEGVSSLSGTLNEKTPYFDSLYDTINANVGIAWSSISISYLNKYNTLYSSLTASSATWNIGNLFGDKFSKYNSFHKTATENITSKWVPDTLNKVLTSDSVKWDSTYNTLTSLSSGWIFDETRNSLNFYNNLTSNSATWNNSYNLVTLSANNWNRSNVISSGSAKYLTGDFLTPLTVNNLTVDNVLSTSGTVTILGNLEKYDTTIVTTSTFNIYNESTNDALIVDKVGGYGVVATFKNPLSTNVLFVDSDHSVGINTTFDATETLTVSGNISASGYIYPYLSDTINTYKSVSAKYGNVYSSLTASSATTIATLTSQKPNYDSLVSYQNLSTNRINTLLSTNYVNYNTLYSTVCAQSAKNVAVKQFLDLSAAYVGIDNQFQNQKFKYDSLYNFYLESQ
jgi:hypothetical protein